MAAETPKQTVNKKFGLSFFNVMIVSGQKNLFVPSIIQHDREEL